MQIRILTLNVRTPWRDMWNIFSEHFWIRRYRAIRRQIQIASPEVLCLQECWFPGNLFIPGDYKRVTGFLTGHPIYAQRGVFTVVDSNDQPHWSAVGLRIAGRTIRIMNVHSSWCSEIHDQVIRDVNSCVVSAHVMGESFIACGDWNNDPAVNGRNVRCILMAADGNTFMNYRSGAAGRLDYFYVDERDGRDRVWMRAGCMLSDHNPVYLDKFVL